MARGRPPIITDERLLEIAREVFLEQGIRATTAEVAERAGISEATVFHRYKTKDSLFRAAMLTEIYAVPPILDTLAERVGKGELANHLRDIALAFIEFGRMRLPLMMMAWSNPSAVLDRLGGRDGPAVQLRECLVAYLDAERRAGRLVSVEPEILTKIFLGSIHGFLMSEMLEWKSPRMPAGTFVQGLVQLIVDAQQARQPSPTRDAALKRIRR